MRIVVVGASGNIGTALLEALREEPAVSSLVGLARRVPRRGKGVEWHAADVASSDLEPHFRGADAVVSLAWRIQPSRRQEELWRTNVDGSTRVFEAAGRAGVPTLVYGSSVGAYAPTAAQGRADESWPIGGVATSFYARHKAEVERRLDQFEATYPGVRVVRMRPALVFQRLSAAEQRRLFLGPLLPSPLLRRGLLPFVPSVRGLRFQAIHADDVADAYRRALLSDVRGAFNLAAEPVLGEGTIGTVLGARTVSLPVWLARAGVTLTWKLRLQPTPPGWLDMGLGVPLLDTARARAELGWSPRRDARSTLAEVLDGIRRGDGAPTPPLDPDAGGRFRHKELLTLAGTREHV
ncbi:MAG TPA: NAD-dependent epimerase/dehydratase family protein [Gaiella sp.]|jgi:nucleoside-diphosphate-sugar epimerase|nr:NAD-dependent epimerase/dehydratase family protein [Gaiella sp.]